MHPSTDPLRTPAETTEPAASQAAVGATWLARLQHPRAHVWLTVLAVLLMAPSLATGLLIDDYVLSLQTRADTGIAGLPSKPWLLFSFTSGRPADNLALIEHGVLLPWWGSQDHLNAFFRPLSALTHRLDFALWPGQPWLMHLQSLLWFAALLLVIAHVYRTLDAPDAARQRPSQSAQAHAHAAPTLAAVLAFAIFALDDAHGMTVAWIANRNALIATALALPALSAHHRYRAYGWRPGAWLAPLCFALGLCAGEITVAVFGYLIAYAACMDRAPIVRRAASLLPFVALIAVWRVVFVALGMGSAGSGAYHDPGHEPLAYAAALIHHVPVLLSAQLGIPLADNWFWGPPNLDAPIWLLSVATLGGLLLAGHVTLSRDREARFWMVGMLLSACAVGASLPGERLLLVPGIGAAMFVAKLLLALWPQAGTRQPAWAKFTFGALVFLHLIAAPFATPVRAASMGILASAVERVANGIPRTPDVADKTVVVINAPADILVNYAQIIRAERGVPRPRHLYWLATASSEISVQALDDATLRVQPAGGFMLSPPERHYRADPSALTKGSVVELSEMSARIVETTPDRRPAVVDFRFKHGLGARDLVLLSWQDGELVPFTPPPRGQSVRFPRVDFFLAMSAEALKLLGAPW